MVNRTTPTTRQGGRRCPLPASLIAGLAALLGVLAPACASAADSLPSSQSVLLLYAESRVLPAVVRVDEAIRARFDAASLQAEFFTEYLDLSSASGARYAEHLRPFFLTKHRGRKFDVVVSVGTEALRFALDNRPVLFPGVPIVFCLASRAAVGDFRLPPDATGVWIVVDAAATLEAAHRLEPRARRAVVVAGAATADRILLDDVKRDLATRPTGLEVSYLAGLPLDEVREKLSRLPRETIVLFVTMFRDGAGRTFSPSQALGTIAPSSNAPVYGMSQTYLGRGIVGGRVFSLDAHGALAADLAIRILRGEPVPHIATVENPTNTYLFDWRQLNRFDLPERNVPAGSVILNRAPPLWEAYRWYIVAAVGLALITTVNQLSQGIVSLYSSITQDLSSIGANAQ